MLDDLQTGALFGTVVDDQGQALPGVTVTLTAPTQVEVTDALGRFRYPVLAPGTYRVTAELEGFNRAVDPSVGVWQAATPRSN